MKKYDYNLDKSIEDSLENRLMSTLNHVYDAEKFAEAKNATMVALCGAGIIGIIDRIESVMVFKELLGFIIALVFLGISLISGVVSFLPQIQRSINLRKKPEISPQDNLLFYGDLYKYTPAQLISTIAHDITGNGRSFVSNRILMDIAHQIIENSKIALYKFRIFTVGAWAFLFCVIFSGIYAIICLI